MSFVGTRPEVTKYVKKYTKEMRATLLLPAGITSEASIQYKDEAELLDAADYLISQFLLVGIREIVIVRISVKYRLLHADLLIIDV